MKEEDIIDKNSDFDDKESNYDELSSLDKGYSLKRITFRSLMEFIFSVLNFEKGILFTIKELILRPRIVVEEYLKKDRKKLVNPIRFLVFSTALASFLNIILVNQDSKFNSFQADFNSGFNEGYENSKQENKSKLMDSIGFSTDSAAILLDSLKVKEFEEKDKKMKEFGNKIQEITKKNSDKFTFILVLFFSFFTFLLFRKNGYNLTENLVINSFLSSITNIITIISILFAMSFGAVNYIIIGYVITILFTLYFWMSVYNRKSIGGFFKSILTYLLSYLTFMLVLGFFAFIYALFTMGIS